MPRYRLYFISPTPKHIRDSDIVDFEAEDDAAAESHMREMADGRAMELWRGELVLSVTEPDSP